MRGVQFAQPEVEPFWRALPVEAWRGRNVAVPVVGVYFRVCLNLCVLLPPTRNALELLQPLGLVPVLQYHESAPLLSL